MTRLTLAALLLYGCASYYYPDGALRPTPEQWSAIDAVERAWSYVGLRSTDTRECRVAKRHLRIRIGTTEEVRGACVADLGCVRGVGPPPLGDEYSPRVTIWVNGEVGDPLRTLRHEVIHLLGDCTDRGKDRGHQDALLWAITPDGVEHPESVEARANGAQQ